MPKVNIRDERALMTRICVIGTVYSTERLIKGNERRMVLLTALTVSLTQPLSSCHRSHDPESPISGSRSGQSLEILGTQRGYCQGKLMARNVSLKDDISPLESGMTSGSTASTMHHGHVLKRMASAPVTKSLSDKPLEKAIEPLPNIDQ